MSKPRCPRKWCNSKYYNVVFHCDGITCGGEGHYDVECKTCGFRYNIWQHELDNTTPVKDSNGI